MTSEFSSWHWQEVLPRFIFVLLLLLLPLSALGFLVEASSGTIELKLPSGTGFVLPVKVVLLTASLLGGVLVGLFWWGFSASARWGVSPTRESRLPPGLASVAVVLLCLVVLAVAALRTEEITYTRAALLVVFGAIALGCAGRAMALLDRGQQIEMQSEWGGIGGGLGGWRLSPAAGLALIALIAGGAAIGVVPPTEQGRGKDKQVTMQGEKAKGDAKPKAPDPQPTGTAPVNATPGKGS